LFVFDTQTANTTPIDVGRRSTFGATWSPDGRTIASIDSRGSGDSVYGVDIDTGAVTVLFESHSDLGFPDWSSDGRIAMTAGDHV
jgi:Tol biopolymer transport system component